MILINSCETINMLAICEVISWVREGTRERVEILGLYGVIRKVEYALNSSILNKLNLLLDPQTH